MAAHALQKEGPGSPQKAGSTPTTLAYLCSAGTTHNGPGFAVNASFQNRIAAFSPVVTVQLSCSVMSTLCGPMDCSPPGLPVHHQLPEFTQTHLHQVDDAIQPSHPLSSLLLLPSILPNIRVFSSESALHIRWPKHWSFSLNISPSNEHPGLISSRMDWLDLLAVQGTLKSLLQHHSSKA